MINHAQFDKKLNKFVERNVPTIKIKYVYASTRHNNKKVNESDSKQTTLHDETRSSMKRKITFRHTKGHKNNRVLVISQNEQNFYI